jgi:pyruvate formate lyase activating enzyme
VTGYVYRIDRAVRGDGPGLRTTVRLKGCPLRCAWCDSPESHHMEPELVFRPDACIRCLSCLDDCQLGAIYHHDREPRVDAHVCRWCGDCADGCPTDARTQAGSVMTESRVMEELRRDGDVHESSGGGVTFSGGEPLMQAAFLERLLEACGRLGVHRAVDTCGHADADVVSRVAARTDLFLYDLKHLDDDVHRRVTGVSNRLILDNLRALAAGGAAIDVRVALVPGINDDDDHLRRLGRFVAGCGLPAVTLLSYRPEGAAAYPALGREYKLVGVHAPTAVDLDRAARAIGEGGVTVTVIEDRRQETEDRMRPGSGV